MGLGLKFWRLAFGGFRFRVEVFRFRPWALSFSVEALGFECGGGPETGPSGTSVLCKEATHELLFVMFLVRDP